MSKVDLEGALLFQIRASGLPLPERQVRFHKSRLWRLDFGWESVKLGVEVEGATFAQGRHTRGQGYEDDCIKEAEAVLLGWRVLRVTGQMIADGRALRLIERALKGEADAGD